MRYFVVAIRLALLTLATMSVAYPLVLWGVGNLFVPYLAQGSLLYGSDGKTAVGSELIGQKFTQPWYFWPRPSAADYHAAAAGGSNFGPTNPKLTERAKETLALYHLKANQTLPSDLIAASGSGLDPHISIDSAYLQLPRVTEHRNISQTTLKKIIDTLAFRPAGGFSKQRIVNVLQLNIELDKTLMGNAK